MSGKAIDKIKASGDPRDKYELQAKIGKGAYGYVCRAIDTTNNQHVAIKIINLEDAGDEVEDVHQEIAVMSNMNCPQLTKYFSSYVLGMNLWIVMEYLEGGSLLDIIKDKGPLKEEFVTYIMRELLRALAYLHSERKIHRDVKAGNILVAADGSVKLADFGVTGQLTDSIDKRQTKIGTPFWMAPEVISQSAYDGCADVWSAGITAIELCTGAPPYANRIHPFQAILLIPKNPPPQLEGAFSNMFKDFVASCLVKDPAARPSAAALLQHPFLTAVTGIPPSWASFILSTVEESRAKAVAMSNDESLEQSQLGFETGDWNFTSRTGVSDPNISHSRSNSQPHSRMGSFSHHLGLDGNISSSTSTVGGKPSAERSRSQSRGQSKAFRDISVRGTSSRLADGAFRCSSSDSAGSGEDARSEEDSEEEIPQRPSRMSVPMLSISSDCEGIGFPSTFPSKVRSPLMPLGRSGSPSASPRLGRAPPRPRSIALADAEAERAAALQEERLANLQQEVQALSRENSLLRSIAGPYMRALEVLSRHHHEAVQQEHLPGIHAERKTTAEVKTKTIRSLSTAIQDAAYAETSLSTDELINHIENLTSHHLVTASPAYKNILMPAVNQLYYRAIVEGKKPVPQAPSSRPSSLRRAVSTPSQAEQVEDVLRLLTVALAGLDAYESTNPLQRLVVEQKQHALPGLAVPVPAEDISLTAPTPKAVHTSQPAVGAHVSGGGKLGGRPLPAAPPAPTMLELAVVAPVPGVGSLDLLTLLTAYLEEDLRHPSDSAPSGHW